MSLLDVLPPEWETWEPVAKRRLIGELQAAIARRRAASWQPYPWQRLHSHPPERGDRPCADDCWSYPDAVVPTLGTWLELGGRGTGKTDGASKYVLEHVMGPACDPRLRGGHRIAIVAPTLGDAVESCVTGPSGMSSFDSRVTAHTAVGGTYVKFPNGAQARVFGAHTPNDIERLRAGGNRCLVWLEELGAMRQLAGVLEHTAFGLRLGTHPHYVGSTTPKVRPEIRALIADPGTVKTWGTTDRATHLDQSVRDVYERKYAGTRIGRQELGGELLEDVEGALWTLELIDRERITLAQLPQLKSVTVAVDPNAGGPDEAGIVVVGIGADQLPDISGRLTTHGYVLEDCSDHFSSSAGWARAAVAAYHRWRADAIVGEINNGGDMVGLVVRQVDANVNYREVRATRGKAVRAEPVVGLYAQRRMHHVGTFPKLEDQQTSWTEDAGYSPDRLDALVWGVFDRLMRTRGGGFASVA